jgi:NAD(P)-dependent dehydrogenase (short-subunit alcohol dehydrogenase family)
MPSFAEYSVLVAGGTGGLGRAVALAFLAEGACVAVTYRNPGELAELQSAARAGAARLEGHASDVTDEGPPGNSSTKSESGGNASTSS